MVHFQPLFGPFWVQKSSWSLILSSLPYFNILHYPNVTSLSCKGGATFSFCIFCIRVAPALLDWSWARCDEHVTIETRTSIFRLYVRVTKSQKVFIAFSRYRIPNIVSTWGASCNTFCDAWTHSSLIIHEKDNRNDKIWCNSAKWSKKSEKITKNS